MSRKKNNKKIKNKNFPKKISTTVNPKIQIKAKHKSSAKPVNSNITNPDMFKYKKVQTTTELSPYFYAISNSNPKAKLDQESVRQYLKFVKNITITYPIIIPSRDSIKTFTTLKKSQKLKEKSRDINSNRNIKLVVPKTTEASTSKSPVSHHKGKMGNTCMSAEIFNFIKFNVTNILSTSACSIIAIRYKMQYLKKEMSSMKNPRRSQLAVV